MPGPIQPIGKGQPTTPIPPMIHLTGIPPKLRKTPVALFATRPQVPVPAHCPVLPAVSPLISLMQTALPRDVTPQAYEHPMKCHTPTPLCTDLLQETIWLIVKNATESQALLTLPAVSPPLAAQTILPAIPMPGPIPLIGPATATRVTKSMPAPSATITLDPDQDLIQPRPAVMQTASEVTNVMREARGRGTMTDPCNGDVGRF